MFQIALKFEEQPIPYFHILLLNTVLKFSKSNE